MVEDISLHPSDEALLEEWEPRDGGDAHRVDIVREVKRLHQTAEGQIGVGHHGELDHTLCLKNMKNEIK